jgi:hypothetical protein
MSQPAPGQYVLGYVQSFLEAHAGEADKAKMEKLVEEARALVQPKRP